MTGLFALPKIPKLDVRLRPYQQDVIARARTYYEAGGRRLLIQAPTGAGKTITFTFIVTRTVENGGTALILAHRQELIGQAYDKLTKAPPVGLGIPEALVGVIMAQDARTRPSAPIQVASVQTVASRIARRGARPDGGSWRAEELGLPPARLVVTDECHRAVSASYQAINGLYPDAFHIGMTATPYRLDGRGLGEFYDELVVSASVEQLIAGGWLVRSRVYSHAVKADLSGVRTGRGGDYDERSLTEAVDRDVLVGNVVDHWLSHAGGARTFVFGASVPHARHIAERFAWQGIPAAFVGADTPRADRARALADFRAGRLLVLCNYDVFTEGTDVPECKCAVLARPTKSESVYRQSVGRAMRAIDGWPELTTCVVLDHAGSALRFGLPEDAQEFSLRGRERRGGGEAPTKECPGCWRVIPANAATCPECGWLFGEERETGALLKEKDGQLVEVVAKEKVKVKELRSTIHAICGGADEARGWQPGTTNKAVFVHYGKSRTEMSLAELRDVLTWLTGPGLAREFPVPEGTEVER